MLDTKITARAERSVSAVARIDQPNDPAYTGPLAIAGRQVAACLRREGTLICDAIHAVFANSTRYEAIRNVHVPIDRVVRTVAAARFTDVPVQMRRSETGRGVRIDIMILDRQTGAVFFLEIKRGVTSIGSDHMARLMDNWRALEVIGADVAAHHFGKPVSAVRNLVVSYYGQTGAEPAHTLTRETLDAFFGLRLSDSVEAHLQYFRFLVAKRVPGLTGYTRDADRASPVAAA